MHSAVIRSNTVVHYSMILDKTNFVDGVPKCCIQTKMYRLYRTMIIYSHVFILCLHFGLKMDPQNVVIKQKCTDYIEK